MSFLHYFHAAISNHPSEKPNICLVVYGRLTQVDCTFYMKLPCPINIRFISYDCFEFGFELLQSGQKYKCTQLTCNVVMVVVINLLVPTKVLYNIWSFVCLISCFMSTVNSLGHIGTISYLTTLFLGMPPGGSLPVLSAHSFASN